MIFIGQASFRRADVVRDAGVVASPEHGATIRERWLDR